MYSLLLATLLSLPIAPLNPIQQDTLDQAALHFTAGIASPNGIVQAGPEISSKLEMLIIHPLVIRAGVDYRFAPVRAKLYPDGDFHQGIFSIEAIYYRGTNHLTGYLGLGAVYAIGDFNPTTGTADSLARFYGIDDVGIGGDLGYRITMGLRYHETLSLEVGITELKPKFVYKRRYSSTETSQFTERFRNSSFRVSIGYVWSVFR